MGNVSINLTRFVSGGDSARYSVGDIQAAQDDAGNWVFTRKDGTLY